MLCLFFLGIGSAYESNILIFTLETITEAADCHAFALFKTGERRSINSGYLGYILESIRFRPEEDERAAIAYKLS